MAYSGHVHSVFRQTLNISADDGKLYCIASAGQDNAPRSIRVAAPIPFNEMGIEPGDKVQVTEGKLTLSQVTIDMAGITCWQSALPAFPGREAWPTLDNSIQVLRQCIERHGKSGGLRELWFESQLATSSFFGALLTENARNFLLALRNQDCNEAYCRGCELIGLGGGLTPSGDDFCAALITIINMPGSPFAENYRQLGYRLADSARRQTTVISQDMLELAAYGQARENVIALLREVSGGSAALIEAAVMKVLQYGSLSGTDWAVGLTAGLELGRELAEIGE